MDIIILSDFDGTIINIDSCEYILSKFVPHEEWKIYDYKYERGEIPLEEAMRKQYGLIKEGVGIFSTLEDARRWV